MQKELKYLISQRVFSVVLSTYGFLNFEAVTSLSGPIRMLLFVINQFTHITKEFSRPQNDNDELKNLIKFAAGGLN